MPVSSRREVLKSGTPPKNASATARKGSPSLVRKLSLPPDDPISPEVKERGEAQYSAYLRSYLLNYSSLEEQNVAENIYVGTEFKSVENDVGENKVKYSMKAKNQDLLEKKKDIEQLEGISLSSQDLLDMENPEEKESMEKFASAFHTLVDILPIVNSNSDDVKLVQINEFNDSVQRLHGSLWNSETGASVVAGILNKSKSLEDELKEAEFEKESIQKFNNQLARLDSMKISLDPEYEKEMENEESDVGSVSVTGSVMCGAGNGKFQQDWGSVLVCDEDVCFVTPSVKN